MDDCFKQTPTEIWQHRRDWIDKEIEEVALDGCDTCDHSVVLFMDMSLAYCAGAWLSVIVMSISVIDAHLRGTEALDDKDGTAHLLSSHYQGDNINWLRKLRNKYVHFNPDKPLFEMNDFFYKQDELEKEATIAMKMTIKALSQSWGV
jgi:hypothetical protein